MKLDHLSRDNSADNASQNIPHFRPGPEWATLRARNLNNALLSAAIIIEQ